MKNLPIEENFSYESMSIINSIKPAHFLNTNINDSIISPY